jgi:hypothetical protein
MSSEIQSGAKNMGRHLMRGGDIGLQTSDVLLPFHVADIVQFQVLHNNAWQHPLALITVFRTAMLPLNQT